MSIHQNVHTVLQINLLLRGTVVLKFRLFVSLQFHMKYASLVAKTLIVALQQLMKQLPDTDGWMFNAELTALPCITQMAEICSLIADTFYKNTELLRTAHLAKFSLVSTETNLKLLKDSFLSRPHTENSLMDTLFPSLTGRGQLMLSDEHTQTEPIVSEEEKSLQTILQAVTCPELNIQQRWPMLLTSCELYMQDVRSRCWYTLMKNANASASRSLLRNKSLLGADKFVRPETMAAQMKRSWKKRENNITSTVHVEKRKRIDRNMTSSYHSAEWVSGKYNNKVPKVEPNADLLSGSGLISHNERLTCNRQTDLLFLTGDDEISMMSTSIDPILGSSDWMQQSHSSSEINSDKSFLSPTTQCVPKDSPHVEDTTFNFMQNDLGVVGAEETVGLDDLCDSVFADCVTNLGTSLTGPSSASSENSSPAIVSHFLDSDMAIDRLADSEFGQFSDAALTGNYQSENPFSQTTYMLDNMTSSQKRTSGMTGEKASNKHYTPILETLGNQLSCWEQKPWIDMSQAPANVSITKSADVSCTVTLPDTTRLINLLENALSLENRLANKNKSAPSPDNIQYKKSDPLATTSKSGQKAPSSVDSTKKGYVCNKCNKSFQWWFQLSQHIAMQHSDTESDASDDCSDSSQRTSQITLKGRKESLRRKKAAKHKKVVLKPEYAYFCPKCKNRPWQTTDLSKLKAHLKSLHRLKKDTIRLIASKMKLISVDTFNKIKSPEDKLHTSLVIDLVDEHNLEKDETFLNNKSHATLAAHDFEQQANVNEVTVVADNATDNKELQHRDTEIDETEKNKLLSDDEKAYTDVDAVVLPDVTILSSRQRCDVTSPSDIWRKQHTVMGVNDIAVKSPADTQCDDTNSFEVIATVNTDEKNNERRDIMFETSCTDDRLETPADDEHDPVTKQPLSVIHDDQKMREDQGNYMSACNETPQLNPQIHNLDETKENEMEETLSEGADCEMFNKQGENEPDGLDEEDEPSKHTCQFEYSKTASDEHKSQNKFVMMTPIETAKTQICATGKTWEQLYAETAKADGTNCRLAITDQPSVVYKGSLADTTDSVEVNDNTEETGQSNNVQECIAPLQDNDSLIRLNNSDHKGVNQVDGDNLLMERENVSAIAQRSEICNDINHYKSEGLNAYDVSCKTENEINHCVTANIEGPESTNLVFGLAENEKRLNEDQILHITKYVDFNVSELKNRSMECNITSKNQPTSGLCTEQLTLQMSSKPIDDKDNIEAEVTTIIKVNSHNETDTAQQIDVEESGCHDNTVVLISKNMPCSLDATGKIGTNNTDTEIYSNEIQMKNEDVYHEANVAGQIFNTVKNDSTAYQHGTFCNLDEHSDNVETTCRIDCTILENKGSLQAVNIVTEHEAPYPEQEMAYDLSISSSKPPELTTDNCEMLSSPGTIEQTPICSADNNIFMLCPAPPDYDYVQGKITEQHPDFKLQQDDLNKQKTDNDTAKVEKLCSMLLKGIIDRTSVDRTDLGVNQEPVIYGTEDLGSDSFKIAEMQSGEIAEGHFIQKDNMAKTRAILSESPMKADFVRHAVEAVSSLTSVGINTSTTDVSSLFEVEPERQNPASKKKEARNIIPLEDDTRKKERKKKKKHSNWVNPFITNPKLQSAEERMCVLSVDDLDINPSMLHVLDAEGISNPYYSTGIGMACPGCGNYYPRLKTIKWHLVLKHQQLSKPFYHNLYKCVAYLGFKLKEIVFQNQLSLAQLQSALDNAKEDVEAGKKTLDISWMSGRMRIWSRIARSPTKSDKKRKARPNNSDSKCEKTSNKTIKSNNFDSKCEKHRSSRNTKKRLSCSACKSTADTLRRSDHATRSKKRRTSPPDILREAIKAAGIYNSDESDGGNDSFVSRTTRQSVAEHHTNVRAKPLCKNTQGKLESRKNKADKTSIDKQKVKKNKCKENYIVCSKEVQVCNKNVTEVPACKKNLEILLTRNNDIDSKSDEKIRQQNKSNEQKHKYCYLCTLCGFGTVMRKVSERHLACKHGISPKAMGKEFDKQIRICPNDKKERENTAQKTSTAAAVYRSKDAHLISHSPIESGCDVRTEAAAGLMKLAQGPDWLAEQVISVQLSNTLGHNQQKLVAPTSTPNSNTKKRSHHKKVTSHKKSQKKVTEDLWVPKKSLRKSLRQSSPVSYPCLRSQSNIKNE